jgi:hypothetical protein
VFLRAKRDAARMAPWIWKRRRHVQDARKIDSWHLLKAMDLGVKDIWLRIRSGQSWG